MYDGDLNRMLIVKPTKLLVLDVTRNACRQKIACMDGVLQLSHNNLRGEYGSGWEQLFDLKEYRLAHNHINTLPNIAESGSVTVIQLLGNMIAECDEHIHVIFIVYVILRRHELQ